MKYSRMVAGHPSKLGGRLAARGEYFIFHVVRQWNGRADWMTHVARVGLTGGASNMIKGVVGYVGQWDGGRDPTSAASAW